MLSTLRAIQPMHCNVCGRPYLHQERPAGVKLGRTRRNLLGHRAVSPPALANKVRKKCSWWRINNNRAMGTWIWTLPPWMSKAESPFFVYLHLTGVALIPPTHPHTGIIETHRDHIRSIGKWNIHQSEQYRSKVREFRGKSQIAHGLSIQMWVKGTL